MGADLSTSQTQIIEVLRALPAQGEKPAQSRVEKLVPLIAGEDLTGPFGALALMAACDVGDAQCVMVLIVAGCDPNATTDDTSVADGETGITPLIAAAAHGHADCIRECLRAGADPAAKSSAGRTFLDAAISSGNIEAIRIAREAPHAAAAAEARRTSAYTKAHLGLDRLNRQAIAVHVIDYTTDARGETRYVVESEDNYHGERKCYYVERSLSQFRQLHDEMVRSYASLPKAALQNTAPKCPGRQSATAKRERMHNLEEYLRLVLSHIEQSVGGKYQVFRKDPNKPGKNDRSPAELPFELVVFLGLEGTDIPDACRDAVQMLRKRGPDGAESNGEAGKPVRAGAVGDPKDCLVQ